MKYSAVIFDFNGTLYWDTHLHNEAWDKFLTDHAMFISDKEKGQFVHGKTNQEIFRYLMGDHLTLSEVNRYINEKEEIYRNLCKEARLDLAPGARELLDFLKQKRIKFTIATSSGIENVDFYFDFLQLARWFDEAQVVYNNGILKSKPDPEIFLVAMQKLGVRAEETIIFEDTITGIEAAIAARPGKIIQVNSNPSSYFNSGLEVIRNFSEVERSLFV